MQLNRNASLLGYDEDVKVTIVRVNSVLDWRKRDLIADIALNRYFVVLMAYDFQLMWKEKRNISYCGKRDSASVKLVTTSARNFPQWHGTPRSISVRTLTGWFAGLFPRVTSKLASRSR